MNENPASPARLGERVEHGRVLMWDSSVLPSPPADAVFDPTIWRDQGTLIGEAEGRGAACFLRIGAETVWVLRHYRRGGLIAHLNRDRYVWTGARATRPAREVRLLAALYNRGLPVPRPVAARAVRHGATYTADLITEAIPESRPLADCLGDDSMPRGKWEELGTVIARLHRAGVWHADLNARNVLVDRRRSFYLIDFDRARFRGDGRWPRANLKRLRRSLDKFAASRAGFHFAEDDWRALLDGYRATSGRL